METNVTNLLEKASGLLDHGQLAQADAMYKSVCELDPTHAEAWLMRGCIYGELGSLTSAVDCLRESIRLRPDCTEAYLALGQVLNAQGNRSDALASLRKAVELDPEDDQALCMLANLLVLQQDGYAEATECLRRAVEIKPDIADAWLLLGWTQSQLGDLTEAESCYQRTVGLEPDNIKALAGLADAQMQSGKHAAATATYKKLVELTPRDVGAWINLGNAFVALGNIADAESAFGKAAQLGPDNPNAHANLGMLHQMQGRLFRAEKELDKAVRLAPHSAAFHYQLAGILVGLGRFDEASVYCETAMKLEPGFTHAVTGQASILERKGDYGGAYQLILPLLNSDTKNLQAALIFASLSPRLKLREDAIQILEELARTPNLGSRDLALIHGALGKLYDAKKQYDDAFNHYRRSNRLQPSDFDPVSHSEFVQTIITTFTPQRMESALRAANDTQLLVFIVGMPRSGTTLVEQILASHPGIYGAGELISVADTIHALPDLLKTGETYPRCVNNIQTAALNEIATQILERSRAFDPGASRIVINERPNIFHVGIIAQLFPGARFIHCVRDPLDTCLSCYFQQMTMNYSFSTDLEHLGQYYVQYDKLMKHWKNTLGIPMMEVRYEQLVDNQENVTRALIDFCGLPWDDRCLRFYETNRNALTPSYDQVRNPMYRSSVARWQSYRDYLAPLKRALEIPG
jgi:tetratricopeptide (TPR) repeat protein